MSTGNEYNQGVFVGVITALGTRCRRAMSTTKLCGSDYSSRYKVSTGNEYNQVMWE